MQVQTGGRRRLPQEDLDAEEELRLAVVLNGGVSLAIWMGGVTVEIQRLTARDGVYGRLLGALSCRARADVIAGTSAGGINGGALAVGQVFPGSDVSRLRDVWAQEGALVDLLQEPWKGEPASLLKGDERFLPALRAAFADLLAPAALPGENAYSAEDRPIHLTLTTTLLTADERTVIDALGEEVSQPSHSGRFRFLRTPQMLGQVDDFAPPVGNLADRLALAARCTASFPVAFEPVHVRIEPPPPAATGAQVPGATGEPAGPAPDMSAHANFRVSRWVVDGGVLMNTPLRPVLEAIQAAPAAIQVRRALLLVVPDPYRASPEEKDPEPADERPTTLHTLGHIVQSVESQTVAEELRLIQEHNMRAQARRDSRTDMLQTITTSTDDVAEGLARLADTLFAHYRDIRIWRAASSIAAQTAAIIGEPAERLAHDIRGALREYARSQEHLPWVPDDFETGVARALAAAEAGPVASDLVGDWDWGLATLERLSVAVHDLLKRSVWVLPPDSPERGQIMQLRQQHSRITAQLMALRAADSAYWQARATQVRATQPSGTLPRRVLAEALRSGLEQWHTGLWDFVAAPVAPGRAAAPPPVPSLGTIAASLLDIGSAAASVIPSDLADPQGLLQADRLLVLRRVFDPAPPSIPASGSAATGGPDWGRRMRAALGLEVCFLCLVETDDPTASEQAIELVRISAGVTQPFAPTLTARERVSGLRLGHFAAFLKQTWRVNDWTWGRLDAANRLVALLLDPVRLRRRVLLSGGGWPAPASATGSATTPPPAGLTPLADPAGPTPPADPAGLTPPADPAAPPGGPDPEPVASAEAAPPLPAIGPTGQGSPAARQVLATILGTDPGPQWAQVLALLDGEVSLNRGREILQPLADQLIRELAEQIVAEEEGALLTAVLADEAQGENAMSAGTRWRDARFPAVAPRATASPGPRKESS